MARSAGSDCRGLWAVAALALFVAASCTSESVLEPSATTGVGPTDDVTVDSSTVAPTTPTTSAPTTPTTNVTPTSTTAPTSTVTSLPGEAYTGPGPRAGDTVAVFGVSHDDVLNVREGPGVTFPISGALEPLTDELRITGPARLLATSVWYEVNHREGAGWVNAAFIGFRGLTDDATALVARELGSPLADDDLHALGATIAYAFLGQESGGWIALVAPDEGASGGDVHSVAYDVIGIDDDAVKGYRLVVHARQETTGSPFVMDSVERTHICWRGMDVDGVCS